MRQMFRLLALSGHDTTIIHSSEWKSLVIRKL